jgi:RimJ/RimL family protein N-acetyltransferase
MILHTARLLLRPLDPSDAPATNAYERDPQVVQYTGHGPLSLEESEARIRRALRFEADVPRRVFEFGVVRNEDGAFIGRAGIGLGESDVRQAALWYLLAPHAWGKGYAREAARAVCDFGFGALGVQRIWADIDPRNRASARVVKALGFRLEAHHVENVLVKGAWTDTLIYAILRREWA